MNENNFVRDVVCGMYLTTIDGCKISEVNGKKYYFCCDVCKADFDNHTSKYVENISLGNEQKLMPDKIEWERDPVCGERIIISDAKGKSLYKNSQYHFCCKICKKTFDANPSAYADKDEGYFDPENPNDFLDTIFRIL